MSCHGAFCDLRFVTHIGEKEGDQGGAEDTEALRDLRFLLLDLVGNQGQMAMPMNEASTCMGGLVPDSYSACSAGVR